MCLLSFLSFESFWKTHPFLSGKYRWHKITLLSHARIYNLKFFASFWISSDIICLLVLIARFFYKQPRC